MDAEVRVEMGPASLRRLPPRGCGFSGMFLEWLPDSIEVWTWFLQVVESGGAWRTIFHQPPKSSFPHRHPPFCIHIISISIVAYREPYLTRRRSVSRLNFWFSSTPAESKPKLKGCLLKYWYSICRSEGSPRWVRICLCPKLSVRLGLYIFLILSLY
jgi:hypothetical protein